MIPIIRCDKRDSVLSPEYENKDSADKNELRGGGDRFENKWMRKILAFFEGHKILGAQLASIQFACGFS